MNSNYIEETIPLVVALGGILTIIYVLNSLGF